ncbi:WD40 repeat-like protein [Auriscalpium vulgare]|uniref:WD40 repeat-like protein n=1 Tax=Auriscalpium vulgare TaxID=40419 RepID=A0ACB8S9Y0_9AGAM|nr:WD40 repeat-like protein [Auriscalpium vulgare]
MGIFSSLRGRLRKAPTRCRSSPPPTSPVSSTQPAATSGDDPAARTSLITEKPDEGGGIQPDGVEQASAPGTQAKGRQSCKCASPPDGQRGRNLVVCIDGTANQFSKKNTNVVELYSRLEKDAEQLTYYDSGIGTYVKDSKWSPSYWKQVASHTIDMAIAWNFKRIVLSAYQWLSENYQEGDKIFLFGFSRGAYQVRVIAGMIEKVGLLHKGNNNQIPFAYELYVSTTSNQKRTDGEKPRSKTKKRKDEDTAEEQEELCRRFKETLSRPRVRAHFVGAWDTVSSIGVARGPSLPETTTGMTHVCVFRHALALDERRCKFLPEYANGGDGPPILDDMKGDVKEVWFVGSHSDIGGGNTTNLALDHFGAALRWMSYEALTHGLRMSSRRGEWQSFPPNLSLSWVWKIIEILPLRRLSYKDRDSTTRRPHLGLARQVKNGQMVHHSVFESINTQYTPLACLPEGLSWDVDKPWSLEPDLYSSAVVTVSRLEADNEKKQMLSSAHRDVLTTLLSSEPGRVSLASAPGAGKAVLGALISEHAHYNSNAEGNLRNVNAQEHFRNVQALATAIMAIRPDVRPDGYVEYPEPRPRELVSALKHTTTDAKLYRDFINLFRQIRLCRGHIFSGVNSVAFSPNGERIASGSTDDIVRIWDTHTGELVLPSIPAWQLQEGKLPPPDVPRIDFAATRGDRQHVISAIFRDRTHRLSSHDSRKEAMNLVREGGKLEILDRRILESKLLGYGVLSVAFSPDGQRVAAGSARPEQLEIWHAQTREGLPNPFWFKGNIPFVCCVAFSPDGTRVVSGSLHSDILICDAQTGETVAGPFTGHKNVVQSVAFSPDGKRFVSGSSDMTIRIWKAQTGEAVAGPFTGHTNFVSSVAFSPGGRHVVSGSVDQTIRIWDAQTGETVAGPFKGHTDGVWSVTFSPDGKRVVSGSADGTLRIWDAQTGKTMVGPLRGHTGGVSSVAYSPDGKLVASASGDGTVRIWDAEVDEEPGQ